MTSNTSLYGYSAVGNATIPSNNNTSLYNPGDANAIPINGNVTANNVNVSNNVNVGGQVSVVGNIITDSYFIGDGGLLSNIASSYGNANVAAFLPTYTGNLAGDNLALQGAAAVTGNITTSGYFFGNGSQLTGIAASYGNANVAAFLPTYTGNLAGGNLAIVDAITGATVSTASTISAVGDISTQGSLRTLGAQGNIVGANYVSANYFVGDGSLLTNISGSSYGNANVAAFLPTYGGNVAANTVFGTDVAIQGSNWAQLQYNPDGVPHSQTTIGTGSWFYVDATGAAFESNTTGTVNTVFFGNDGQVSAQGNIIGANINTGGEVTATGNVSGAYILGNGSQLTGLPATYGNANVTSLLAAFGSNTISTSGNITGNYFIGNGSQLTGITTSYGNSNVTSLLAAFGSNTISTSGNISTGNLILPSLGRIYGDWSNATINSRTFIQSTPNLATRFGVIPGAGYTVSGGNVATSIGSFLLSDAGNSSYIAFQITSSDSRLVSSVNGTGTLLPMNILVGSTSAIYIPITGNIGIGNTTPADRLAVTGNAYVSGNIRATYFLGNGSQLTGIAANYGNSNVASFLSAFGSNTISTTGTITSGNITGANISATGNITGSYFLGNGSQLTGIVSSYGNSNVNTLLAAWGSNTLSTTGNITGGNITSTGNLSVLGNLFSDDITSTNVTVYGDQVITGNLTVQGNTTTINSNTVTTNDKNITVANNQSTGANVDGAGLDAGSLPIATWRYNDATTSWQSNIAITPTGNGLQNLGATTNNWNGVYATSGQFSGTVTAANFSGDGSQLTSLTGANVSGTVANATYATSSGSATTAGTVTTNAQPNITSVGTLTSLSITGNVTAGNIINTGISSVTGNITAGNVLTSGLISATGNITGNYFIGNGSSLTGIATALSGNLAGNLLANGYAFTSSANSNIIIQPGGTGTLNTYNQQLNTFQEVVYAYGNTGASTVTPNITLGSIQSMTLTGNITLSTITNIAAGQSMTIILNQDATGNRLLTSTMKFAGGFKTLTTTANAVDIITTFYDGSNYWASLSRGYA